MEEESNGVKERDRDLHSMFKPEKEEYDNSNLFRTRQFVTVMRQTTLNRLRGLIR